MEIAILDGVVAAVVLISALLAMFRGFVREVLSIAAWVAAALLAYFFYQDLLPYVSEYVTNETVAIAISAAGIFLVGLIVVSLITMRISDYVMDSPVGALDRLLGFVFGAARGVLLVVVAVIFFNYLVDETDRPAWVVTALSYPELSRLGEQLLSAIPDDPEAAIRGAFEGEADVDVDVDVDADADPAAPDAAQDALDGAGEAVEPEAEVIEEDGQEQLDQLLDAEPETDVETGAGENEVQN